MTLNWIAAVNLIFKQIYAILLPYVTKLPLFGFQCTMFWHQFFFISVHFSLPKFPRLPSFCLYCRHFLFFTLGTVVYSTLTDNMLAYLPHFDTHFLFKMTITSFLVIRVPYLTYLHCSHIGKNFLILWTSSHALNLLLEGTTYAPTLFFYISSMNIVTICLSFSLGLIWLSTILFKSICVTTNFMTSTYSLVMSHCIHEKELIYLLYVPGVFQDLGYCKMCCNEHRSADIFYAVLFEF